MATVPALKTDFDNATGEVSWSSFAASGDVGGGAQIGAYPDKTVHFTGSAGTGGTMSVEGSNDGTNWVVLHDIGGTVLSGLATDTMWTILEDPLYIRPKQDAGSGASLVAKIFYAKRAP